MSKEKTLFTRKPWTERLRDDVLEFHAQTGMKLTSIGGKAIGNRRMWERFEAGGTLTVEKADQLYAWMAAQGYIFTNS